MNGDRAHAIILGGTSGLGLEIAAQCVENGIAPIILGRNFTKVRKDPRLHDALTFAVDLTNARLFVIDEHKQFEALIRHRHITHVYWCAGIPQLTSFLELKPVEIVELIGIHLTGPLLVLQHLFNLLIARGQPIEFVTISSTSAVLLRSGEEVYCAVKAAKADFTRQMAGTLAKALPGSTVTLVLPGGMNTPFWDATDRMRNIRLLDPVVIAQIITDETIGVDHHLSLVSNFRSLQINRDAQGDPVLLWRSDNPDHLY